MQQKGVGLDQVPQVRGFADQKLRKADNPLDSSNRRITLIVQYIVKDLDEDSTKPGDFPKGAKPAEDKPSPSHPPDH